MKRITLLFVGIPTLLLLQAVTALAQGGKKHSDAVALPEVTRAQRATFMDNLKAAGDQLPLLKEENAYQLKMTKEALQAVLNEVKSGGYQLQFSEKNWNIFDWRKAGPLMGIAKGFVLAKTIILPRDYFTESMTACDKQAYHIVLAMIGGTALATPDKYRPAMREYVQEFGKEKEKWIITDKETTVQFLESIKLSSVLYTKFLLRALFACQPVTGETEAEYWTGEAGDAVLYHFEDEIAKLKPKKQ